MRLYSEPHFRGSHEDYRFDRSQPECLANPDFEIKSIRLLHRGSCIIVFEQSNCTGSLNRRITHNLRHIPDGFDRIGSVHNCGYLAKEH